MQDTNRQAALLCNPEDVSLASVDRFIRKFYRFDTIVVTGKSPDEIQHMFESGPDFMFNHHTMKNVSIVTITNPLALIEDETFCDDMAASYSKVVVAGNMRTGKIMSTLILEMKKRNLVVIVSSSHCVGKHKYMKQLMGDMDIVYH